MMEGPSIGQRLLLSYYSSVASSSSGVVTSTSTSAAPGAVDESTGKKMDISAIHFPGVKPSSDLLGLFVASLATYFVAIAICAAVSRRMHHRWSFAITASASAVVLFLLWTRLLLVTRFEGSGDGRRNARYRGGGSFSYHTRLLVDLCWRDLGTSRPPVGVVSLIWLLRFALTALFGFLMTLACFFSPVDLRSVKWYPGYDGYYEEDEEEIEGVGGTGRNEHSLTMNAHVSSSNRGRNELFLMTGAGAFDGDEDDYAGVEEAGDVFFFDEDSGNDSFPDGDDEGHYYRGEESAGERVGLVRGKGEARDRKSFYDNGKGLRGRRRGGSMFLLSDAAAKTKAQHLIRWFIHEARRLTIVWRPHWSAVFKSSMMGILSHSMLCYAAVISRVFYSETGGCSRRPAGVHSAFVGLSMDAVDCTFFSLSLLRLVVSLRRNPQFLESYCSQKLIRKLFTKDVEEEEKEEYKREDLRTEREGKGGREIVEGESRRRRRANTLTETKEEKDGREEERREAAKPENNEFAHHSSASGPTKGSESDLKGQNRNTHYHGLRWRSRVSVLCLALSFACAGLLLFALLVFGYRSLRQLGLGLLLGMGGHSVFGLLDGWAFPFDFLEQTPALASQRRRHLRLGHVIASLLSVYLVGVFGAVITARRRDWGAIFLNPRCAYALTSWYALIVEYPKRVRGPIVGYYAYDAVRPSHEENEESRYRKENANHNFL